LAVASFYYQNRIEKSFQMRPEAHFGHKHNEVATVLSRKTIPGQELFLLLTMAMT